MSTPLDHELRWLSVTPGLASAAFGPLAISVWTSAPTLEHASTAATLLASLGKVQPKLLVLAVLGPNTPPPDGAVREILAHQLTRLGAQIAAVANVVEGQGFRAATMRAVLTGMVLVIRPTYPQRACATIEEAAGFLAERSDTRLDAPGIVRAVQKLRGSTER